MIQLRDYQIDLVKKGYSKLNHLKMVYLSMEVRTGKTLTALSLADKFSSENVLFVTKKKAIGSINKDYELLKPSYKLTVINYESLHKVKGEFGIIICDEMHSCFLGDTLVGGVKIKDIKQGSFQKSFNFVKKKYEQKKVLNVFKNKLKERLVKIKCNGKEIICTENHKIRTDKGWKKAKNITNEDKLQVV